MSTIELVKSGRVMTAVLDVVREAEIEVLDVGLHHVTVRGGCLPIKITWETCSCHGGRMWFYQDQTGIRIELSSPIYDVEKGIFCPDTELAWYIDNEMLDTIASFERYIYVVDTVGEYVDGKHERRYFDSAERASELIFCEKGHDILTTNEVLHQYPNENMRLRVTYDGDSRESDGKARRARFQCEHLERRRGEQEFHVDREFTREYWVYRKGLS